MIMWIGIFLAICCSYSFFGKVCHGWLLECIYTISLFVLINGSPSKLFITFRGIRHGDPLLFSCLLLWWGPAGEARELGVINGFEVKAG